MPDFTLPLHSQTLVEWARQVLHDAIALLMDHAFLEKKGRQQRHGPANGSQAGSKP